MACNGIPYSHVGGYIIPTLYWIEKACRTHLLLDKFDVHFHLLELTSVFNHVLTMIPT